MSEQTDCRECRAGRLQAERAAIGYWCSEHGMQEYAAGAMIGPLRELVAALDSLLAAYCTEDWRRGAGAADRVAAARKRVRAADGAARGRAADGGWD